MKLQRAAFSAIIWFGDLNACAPRQLLIKGLDLPDTQAEIAGTERKADRARVLLYSSAAYANTEAFKKTLFTHQVHDEQ